MNNTPQQTPTEFADKVLAELKKKKHLIDSVFCFIEQDRDLIKEYLELIAREGSLQQVNSQIAKKIAEHYGRKGTGEEGVPKSRLIQSYSILAKE